MLNQLAEQAHAYLNEEEAPSLDPKEFNTQLAKLLQKLKKDAGAESLQQNYKGTGSQVHRRQLYTIFKSGAVIDLWLESDRLGLGGVVTRGVGGVPMPKSIPYGKDTPEQVYEKAAKLLKAWATPKTAKTEATSTPEEEAVIDGLIGLVDQMKKVLAKQAAKKGSVASKLKIDSTNTGKMLDISVTYPYFRIADPREDFDWSDTELVKQSPLFAVVGSGLNLAGDVLLIPGARWMRGLKVTARKLGSVITGDYEEALKVFQSALMNLEKDYKEFLKARKEADAE